jgi:hypothetical protein
MKTPSARLTRPLALWAPVVAWMAVLFVASALSDPPGSRLLPDWVTHPAAWAVLAALFARALAGGLRPASLRVAVLAAALATAYGVFDEWHQAFTPGRHASVADVGKDMAGAALGAWLFRRLAPHLAPRLEPAA